MNDLERSLSYKASADEISYVKDKLLEKLPKISVVIPSFNQGGFLSQTLDSVLNQNYPNIEIFIADGGSTDNSLTVIKNYKKNYPEIINFESKPDGGHANGVNKGINNTNGDIIAWINSDDIYLPETFWKVATFFYFNRSALVVYGKNNYVDIDLEKIVEYPADWSPLLVEQRRKMMHFCIIPQPSLFFRRHAVTLCGQLASKILDYELWLRWQRNIPFFFYDDVFSLSRIHNEAITANADTALLMGICQTVHRYYGVVPYSWAFKYAYTKEYGAAWASGHNPEITKKIKINAFLFCLFINLKLSPFLIVRSIKQLILFIKEASRGSA